ncbi:hypothetical protein SAMN05216496_3744 [Pseudomonas sp. Z003-0.4C(8344-21)]|nr:hypothetical protein SAMN05216496_3744 [Pseudomonas sp. Z003-0.4C(8344-21)]
MNSVRQALIGSVVTCLLTMSLEAWAEKAQYNCLGQEHGQQATVTAASAAQAAELAKAEWRTVGCYKDDALTRDSAAPPAMQAPPSDVGSGRTDDTRRSSGSSGGDGTDGG